MSVLLDLNTSTGFNEATYRLFRRLQKGERLSLQSLRSHVAQSMGARSLEALQDQLLDSDVEKAGQEDNPECVYSLYWKDAKKRWAVVTCLIPNQRGDDTVRAVLNGNPQHTGTPLAANTPVSEWVGGLPPAELFFGPVTAELVIVDKADKRTWLLPENAVPGSLQIMRLDEYCPELFTVMMAGEEEMEDILFDPKFPLIELVRALGFTQEEYHHQRDNDDTRLGYPEWVQHQVESWCDDVTAHLG